MKKRIYIFMSVLFSSAIFSQVGINTTNPQQIFHVDGLKNNPITGNPTVQQQTDDFVVTTDGKIGVGLIEPTQKLDVEGKVRIRNTDVLTDAHSPLYVDENGILGKSNSIVSQIAFFTSKNNFPFDVDSYNNGEQQEVPVISSHSSLNTIGVTVPATGQIRISKSGVYMISASITPQLNFTDDGDGYAYMAINIDISTNGGASWSSASGGRPVFPRLNVGLVRNYSFTLPTIISTLNTDDLIRIKFYRTKVGATLQGSSLNTISLGSNYGAPTYTLSITKL